MYCISSSTVVDTDVHETGRQCSNYEQRDFSEHPDTAAYERERLQLYLDRLLCESAAFSGYSASSDPTDPIYSIRSAFQPVHKKGASFEMAIPHSGMKRIVLLPHLAKLRTS